MYYRSRARYELRDDEGELQPGYSIPHACVDTMFFKGRGQRAEQRGPQDIGCTQLALYSRNNIPGSLRCGRANTLITKGWTSGGWGKHSTSWDSKAWHQSKSASLSASCLAGTRDHTAILLDLSREKSKRIQTGGPYRQNHNVGSHLNEETQQHVFAAWTTIMEQLNTFS
ncbi:MAG: hypothetical protein ACKPKO_51955, partial [Candidatus Fonsibacter sp.]